MRATASSRARRPRGSSRALGRDVAWDSTGERELGEEPFHALRVLRDAGIDFAVSPFEIGVGDQPRTAMSGAGNVDHIEIVFLDQPIEVRVDEVEARRRAPMPEEARLDVLLLERLAQQGIVEQVDLTDRQIVGGAPIGVDERSFGFRQRGSGFRRAFLFRQSGRGRHRHLLCRMTESASLNRSSNLPVRPQSLAGLVRPGINCMTRPPIAPSQNLVQPSSAAQLSN